MNPRRLFLFALSAGPYGDSALLLAQTSATGLRRVGVLEEVNLGSFFEEMSARLD